MLDENGYGLAQNFVQSKTVRDAAAMLDCLAIPQPGDPFVIPRPNEPYLKLAARKPSNLRIGWSIAPLMGIATDREVAQAVENTAKVLMEMGHDVSEENPQCDPNSMTSMTDVWFFGFDLRLEMYSKRTGRKISLETLEPVVHTIYEHARRMTPARFLGAMAALNTVRRQLGAYYTKYDIFLSPTTARVSEPWGNYNLGRTDITIETMAENILAPVCQFTLPHNIMGTPAISLPLAMHSSGLPIGVQVGGRPAEEHVVLQVAAALEEAMPWNDRVPPQHVSKRD
jgi:amidase